MKKKYLSIIIVMCLLILVSGCGKDDEISGNVVDEVEEAEEPNPVVIIGTGDSQNIDPATAVDQDANTEDDIDTEAEDNTESNPNADLVAELMADLIGDTEDTEEVASGEKEIVIENFRGNPKDVIVEAGTTVTWINKMYFQHIVIILPDQGDGTYANRWINDLEELWYDESYEYTFEEAGKYKWGSKSKFEVTYGTVTVLE